MNDRDPAPPESVPAPALCHRAADRCTMCREMSDMRVMRSEELLQGRRELLIVHAGQVYRLLRTRKDKLILQK